VKIEAMEIQPWAAIAAAAFLMIATRAFWSVMRTSAKRDRKGRLAIHPLTPIETARFVEAWESLQRRFVDNPEWTVGEAEQLARDIMRRRGYHMADFEQQAAALAVDHPDVVAHYLEARAIAARDCLGIDDLRQAVVQYGALFDKLLDVGAPTAAGKLRAEERIE
jgi:hypothetical protein